MLTAVLFGLVSVNGTRTEAAAVSQRSYIIQYLPWKFFRKNLAGISPDNRIIRNILLDNCSSPNNDIVADLNISYCNRSAAENTIVAYDWGVSLRISYRYIMKECAVLSDRFTIDYSRVSMNQQESFSGLMTAYITWVLSFQKQWRKQTESSAKSIIDNRPELFGFSE